MTGVPLDMLGDHMTIASIKPVDERIGESVIRVLEQMILEARRGEITAFVAVVDRGADGWAEKSSGCRDFLRMLGMIELAKQSVVERAFER